MGPTSRRASQYLFKCSGKPLKSFRWASNTTDLNFKRFFWLLEGGSMEGLLQDPGKGWQSLRPGWGYGDSKINLPFM